MFGTQPPPPTQAHIIVKEFRAGVLITTDGTLAYVLEIDPVDLSTLDPNQAMWLKTQFGKFISSVRFPNAIQFVIGSYPQDMGAYLSRLRGRAEAEYQAAESIVDPAASAVHRRMAERLDAMWAFIKRALLQVRPIESRYYVAVFHNPVLLRRGGALTPAVFEKGKQKLEQLLAHVTSGLAHTSLVCHVLNEQQVAQVIHWFYHQQDSPLMNRQSPRLRLLPSLMTSVDTAPVTNEGDSL